MFRIHELQLTVIWMSSTYEKINVFVRFGHSWSGSTYMTNRIGDNGDSCGIPVLTFTIFWGDPGNIRAHCLYDMKL